MYIHVHTYNKLYIYINRYQMEIEWPERKGSSLIKLEEVHTDL